MADEIIRPEQFAAGGFQVSNGTPALDIYQVPSGQKAEIAGFTWYISAHTTPGNISQVRIDITSSADSLLASLMVMTSGFAVTAPAILDEALNMLLKNQQKLRLVGEFSGAADITLRLVATGGIISSI